VRTIDFVTLDPNSRWSKAEIACATETDLELSQFVKWMSNRVLLIDGNDLARFDPVTKTLHSQWERFRVRDGILYQKFSELTKREDLWQLVPPVSL